MADPEVSVIVRTLNEARHLPATLDALAAQRWECGARPEIIVVDSGSTDGTLNIAARRADRVLSIVPAQFSFGRAINVAAAKARGRVLVILSAHALPAGRDWLTRLVAPLETARVAAVYGKQLPRPDAWPPVAVDCRRCYGARPRIHRLPDEVFFSNANAALRRDLWVKMPFDEDLAACEDQAWARRAVDAGFWIVYRPSAAVYHSHNERPRRMIARRLREERGRQAIAGDVRPPGTPWDDWLWSVRADVHFIRHGSRRWRWFLLAPAYRFLWALSPWYSYVQ